MQRTSKSFMKEIPKTLPIHSQVYTSKNTDDGNILV